MTDFDEEPAYTLNRTAAQAVALVHPPGPSRQTSLDPHPALTARSYKSPNVEGGEDAVVFSSGGKPITGSLTTKFGPKNATNHQEVNAGSLVAFNWQTGMGQYEPSTETTGTLNVGQTPAVTTPSVRRLTPLECERLQGFPDGWTDVPDNSGSQRYRQMGNAVAVPVVE